MSRALNCFQCLLVSILVISFVKCLVMNGSSNVGVSTSNSLGPLLEGTSNFSIASQSRLHNVLSIVRMGHSNHVMLKKCQEKRGH